jgi:hypothetical protein
MRLTIKRLSAMREALTARLAGEIDVGDEPGASQREDYEAAIAWVQDKLSSRKNRSRPRGNE